MPDSPYTRFKDAPNDTVLHADAANVVNNVTKGRFLAHVEHIAHGLRHQYGIGANGPGKDVVVVISSGQPLVTCLFYAIIAAGGVFSPAPSSFRAPELARQIEQGGSKLLICSPDVEHIAVEAARQVGLDLSRVLALSWTPEWSLRSLEGGIDCWSDRRLTWKRITDREELKKSLVALIYSAGTTGPPKGVMLSHLNLVAANAIALIRAKRWIEAQDPPPPAVPYRTLAHLPFAHVGALNNYFTRPLLVAGTVYWMREYEWNSFIKYTKELQITNMFTVPSILLRISKSPDVRDHFKSVASAITGTAKVDGNLQVTSSAKMGNGTSVFIGQVWGLTETTGAATMMPMGEIDDTGSISPPLPTVELRLVDDEDNDILEEGQPGELLVRSEDLVMQGYFRDPEATKAAFRNGWFCSGDIAVRRNGKFYIADRKKEVIKYKGEQIAPAELESLLCSHPKIQEAAVIGVPREDGSEVPLAYIVADSGEVSEAEVKQFVVENVSAYKQLRGGVKFVEEIPKSSIGKILRRELREQALREVARTSRL